MNMPHGRILVVDDSEINIEILLGILSKEYEVSVALDGPTALEAIEAIKPDLILLDIMMPGMDGYEVCSRLKASHTTRYIPVIFITALTDVADETKGLALGAIDYLTKPFNAEMIRMRVRNHLALSASQRKLREYNKRLEQEVAKRTRELAQAHEQLKIVDATRRDFLNVIAHDLRTPLNGLLGIAQLALDEVQDEKERQDMTVMMQKSRWRLEETIENALHLTQLQIAGHTMKSQPIVIEPLVRKALDQIKPEFEEAMLTVSYDSKLTGDTVHGDDQLLLLATKTLLRVATRLAKATTLLNVELARNEEELVLRIKLTAPPLPADVIAHIFDECHQNRTYSKLQDLGFAVPLAEKIMRSFGGQVYVVNDTEGVLICCIFHPTE